MWNRVLLLRKNYKMYGLMFILPIVFFLAFGFGSSSQQILVVVSDEDQSVYSHKLIKELEHSPSIEILHADRETLYNYVSERKTEIGLIIEEGSFEDETKPMELVRLTDSLTVVSFEGTLRTIMNNLSYEKSMIEEVMHALTITDSIETDLAEERVATIVVEKLNQNSPVQTRVSTLNAGNDSAFDGQLQMMLGFILFFSIYTIMGSVAEIMNDKRHGIWDRLIISPIDKWGLYVGNFSFSFIISFFQICLLILVSKYVIGLDWGDNLFLVIFIIVIYIISIMSIGIVLVSLSKTIQQFNSIVPIISVSFAMIGGAYWPIEVVSSNILLFLSKFVPVTYAMSAIKDVVFYGASWKEIIYPCSILIIMSALLIGIGVRLLERKVA